MFSCRSFCCISLESERRVSKLESVSDHQYWTLPDARTKVPGRGAAGVLASVLVLAILVVCCFEGERRLSSSLDYRDIVHALRSTQWGVAFGAVALAALSYLFLICRDAYVLHAAQARLRWVDVGLSGFCATALSNAVGLGGMSGAVVRYRIYAAAGLAADDATSVIGSLVVGYGAGLVSAGLAALLFEAVYSHSPLSWMHPGALAALSLALTLLLAVGAAFGGRAFKVFGFVLQIPKAKILLAQMASTWLYLMSAGVCFWLLLPQSGVALASLLPVFAVAMALGGISHVPGGFGAFDAIMFATLSDRVAPADAAAALVVFRAVFYVLPLYVSTALLACSEWRRLQVGRDGSVARAVVGASAKLSPTFIAMLVLFAGFVMLASDATPAFERRLTILTTYLPLWTIETSQFLDSIAGVTMLFLARGLLLRSDAAWWLTLLAAIGAFALSLLKGLAYFEAGMMVALIMLLIVTRRQFSRKASLSAQSVPLWWFVGAVTALLGMSLLFVFAFWRSADNWWALATDERASSALRATVGASVIFIGVGLSRIMRPGQGARRKPTAFDIARAKEIAARQDRSDAFLVAMNDKSLLFSASGASFLMYSQRGRSWIALFEPVGPIAEWPELIWKFIEQADAHGGRAVFYQTQAAALPMFADAGLQIVKIGEEALISLPEFTLKGAERSRLRYALKRGERDGLTFELIDLAATPQAIAAVEQISRDWLEARSADEKGFSVAAFHHDFLASQIIGLVREQGRPTAFVSLMTTRSNRVATVGLMRHARGASPYAMDFLFLRLIDALKEGGYAELSLGVAPLSGLQPCRLGSLWLKLGALIWKHSPVAYNFRGLRAFKSKFGPRWEPRYLAVSGVFGPVFALTDVAALISEGGEGRVA